jgi:hypothetical protein
MDRFLSCEKKMHKEFSKLIAYCTREILRMIKTVGRPDTDESAKLGRHVSHAVLGLEMNQN